MKRRQIVTLLLTAAAGFAFAQNRDYKIHSRGMLHQTVFNSGELGRTYDGGTAGVLAGFPSFEWPGNSAVSIDRVEYSGQHNSFGGGLYVATGKPGVAARKVAYCGAIVGLPVAGTYSFPISIQRRENFPLNADGSLNSLYDTTEAEEIITSKWATFTGITVTRTSRAWSAPDYDDFIIYEYELENTGDVDGNPLTPAVTDTLTEVFIGFGYGFAVGKMGYERTFNKWDGADYQWKDQYGRFDRRRWMSYAMDRDGKPEPNSTYYQAWAQTGENGGGLLAPQAAGFAMLYYDTTSLAHKGETGITVLSADTNNVWDANKHLKQPWLNRMETTQLTQAKIDSYLDPTLTRKNNPYRNLAVFGSDWLGRSAFNVRQSFYFGVGRILAFGPYILKPGQKIRFAYAEVAGYGGARLAETQAGLVDEGGSCGEKCNEDAALKAFNPVQNWWQTITYGATPATFGSTYLTNFPLPQYVNSNVITVRDVADRAIQAYTDGPLVDFDSTQYWPERSAPTGRYRIPTPVPAPIINLSNTAKAENVVSWGRAPEQFRAPRLIAPFAYYEVQKSKNPLGPWTRLDSVGKGDARYLRSGGYEYTDISTRVGEAYYYSVVSVDSLGNRSGRTNITLHQTQIGGTATLSTVYAVPNPFVVRSGYTGTTAAGGDASSKIGFYNLPRKCTIRILSFSGQLVETLTHDTALYSTEYFQVTRNGQLMASGVYFYVVETPDGKRTHGKFIIIH